MNSFKLEVMTPSKRFYRGDVDMVIVTTKEGDEGFMAGHVWACKLLEVGELWILEKGAGKSDWKVAAVAGGFVEMKDSMIIYTDAVEWSEDIDMDRVLSEKARVEDCLVKNPDVDKNSEEMQSARLALAKAEIRAGVARGGKRR